MLSHLEYLRNLHLEAPRLGNTYLEDTALREYSEIIFRENGKDQVGSFEKEMTRLGDRFSN